MQAVSTDFIKAQLADVNLPTAQVQLLLGNYFSNPQYGTTIGSLGDDASGNFPSLGAIDGDRTEINVGAASTADNDVGKSSWRSAIAPDTTPQTLVLTMTTSRTFNRIKIYHLASNPMSSYKLEWWNGIAFIQFAATSDLGGAGTLFTSNNKVDTIDFSDVTATQVRLTVVHMVTAAHKADLVEMECYRKVDITSRVKSVKVSRQRDYKISNPMAANVQLVCNNNDRFFSMDYVPTSAEVTSGFVNSELRPNLGIVVQFGFNYVSLVPELINGFIGYVDSISVRPSSRDATIGGRDSMKILLNRADSSKLKTSQDISLNMQYVLNRSNISSFESALDSTGITVDHFFSDNEAPIDTIRNLVQASGDAQFYFDENGIAKFKFYTTITNNSKLFTSQVDWDSGVKTHIDSAAVVGDIVLSQYGTVTDNFASYTGYTYTNQAFLTFSVSGGKLVTSEAALAAWASNYKASTGNSNAVATWQYTFQFSNSDFNSKEVYQGFLFCSPDGNNGYYIMIIPHEGKINLHKAVGGSILSYNSSFPDKLGGVTGLTPDTNPHTIKITRDNSNNIVVWLDGSAIISVNDNTYTTDGYFGFYAGADVNAPFTFTNLVSVSAFSVTSYYQTGTWQSPTIDMGASVQTLGSLTATQFTNGGTIVYQTQTSDDATTWTGLSGLSGSAIISPVKRYLRILVTLTYGPASAPATPDILDMTATWTSAGGSVKYPTTPVLLTAYESILLDVTQELSDSLGGDTAILNDISVQAAPLVLTGADADTIWQGSVGTPPNNISVGTPLSCTNGTPIFIAPYVGGGMDISRMSGANPAALVVTFTGGGAGSWVAQSIHPTLPIFKITITGTGTITDLRLTGKRYSAATYLQAQTVKDAASIASYGDRNQSISNPWIQSTSLALSIATALVGNYKTPVSYIPTMAIRPNFALQLGDRITVSDINLGVTQDYINVGMDQEFTVDTGQSTIQTALKLLKVP